jgi:hypothetical protein
MGEENDAQGGNSKIKGEQNKATEVSQKQERMRS